MDSEKRRVDLSIDNPVLKDAKQAMNTCMKMAVRKAIETESMEGSVTLKVSFTLERATNLQTGENYISPEIAYKSSYSVPMKNSIDGKVMEACKMVPGEENWLLLNGQISMDEIQA